MTSIINMSLLYNTIMRSTEEANQNLEDMLHKNINNCNLFSFQFDYNLWIT